MSPPSAAARTGSTVRALVNTTTWAAITRRKQQRMSHCLGQTGPFGGFTNPNFTFRGGFPPEPSPELWAPRGHSWSPRDPRSRWGAGSPLAVLCVVCSPRVREAPGALLTCYVTDTSGRMPGSRVTKPVRGSSAAPVPLGTVLSPQSAFTRDKE